MADCRMRLRRHHRSNQLRRAQGRMYIEAQRSQELQLQRQVLEKRGMQLHQRRQRQEWPTRLQLGRWRCLTRRTSFCHTSSMLQCMHTCSISSSSSLISSMQQLLQRSTSSFRGVQRLRRCIPCHNVSTLVY